MLSSTGAKPSGHFRSNGPCASKNRPCTLCRSLCWSRPHSYLSYTLWRNKRDRRQLGQQTKPPHLEQTERWGKGSAWERDYGFGKRHLMPCEAFLFKGVRYYSATCWARECGVWEFLGLHRTPKLWWHPDITSSWPLHRRKESRTSPNIQEYRVRRKVLFSFALLTEQAVAYFISIKALLAKNLRWNHYLITMK